MNTDNADGNSQSQFRIKKYDFAGKGLSKKEYHKKWYDANKEKLKDELKHSYTENKDQLKEKSKTLQQKYRESHRILKVLYDSQFKLSDDLIEKIKKIIE